MGVGRAGSGGGEGGRVGEEGQRGVKRVGSGRPVRSCYVALLTWLSYMNTIQARVRAVCVWSDGECDQNLAVKVGYRVENFEKLAGKKWTPRISCPEIASVGFNLI
jgi:hypothetical protein